MIASTPPNPGDLNPDDSGVAFGDGGVADGGGEVGAVEESVTFAGGVSSGAGVGTGFGPDTVISALPVTVSFSAVTVVFPAASAAKSPVLSIVPAVSLLLVHSRPISAISWLS